MTQYLFVYGTLLPGAAPEEIADVATQLRAVGRGSVQGSLYGLGHFPGAIVESVSGRRVFGMVFELPSNPGVLRALDEYEEFDPHAPASSQFLRVRGPAELDSGARLDCWMYVYNRALTDAPLIESGEWPSSSWR